MSWCVPIAIYGWCFDKREDFSKTFPDLAPEEKEYLTDWMDKVNESKLKDTKISIYVIPATFYIDEEIGSEKGVKIFVGISLPNAFAEKEIDMARKTFQEEAFSKKYYPKQPLPPERVYLGIEL